MSVKKKKSKLFLCIEQLTALDLKLLVFDTLVKHVHMKSCFVAFPTQTGKNHSAAGRVWGGGQPRTLRRNLQSLESSLQRRSRLRWALRNSTTLWRLIDWRIDCFEVCHHAMVEFHVTMRSAGDGMMEAVIKMGSNDSFSSHLYFKHSRWDEPLFSACLQHEPLSFLFFRFSAPIKQSCRKNDTVWDDKAGQRSAF